MRQCTSVRFVGAAWPKPLQRWQASICDEPSELAERSPSEPPDRSPPEVNGSYVHYKQLSAQADESFAEAAAADGGSAHQMRGLADAAWCGAFTAGEEERLDATPASPGSADPCQAGSPEISPDASPTGELPASPQARISASPTPAPVAQPMTTTPPRERPYRPPLGFLAFPTPPSHRGPVPVQRPSQPPPSERTAQVRAPCPCSSSILGLDTRFLADVRIVRGAHLFHVRHAEKQACKHARRPGS